MKKKILNIIILIIGISIFYFLNQKFKISIPCPFHKLTNLYCPGCGITRMFIAIIHLNFYQAFRYNPLVFILLISYLLIKFIELITKKKIIFNNRITYTLLIIVILFGVLRNIPYFDILAPNIVG